MQSKSYQKCHCGLDCQLHDSKEPCWGRVIPVFRDVFIDSEDEHLIFNHACEGHYDQVDFGIDIGKYKSEKEVNIQSKQSINDLNLPIEEI